MFTGRGQEPLTSSRTPQDSAEAEGPPSLPASVAFLGQCQGWGGHTHTHTHTPHLSHQILPT
jgi:hypothetical protein